MSRGGVLSSADRSSGCWRHIVGVLVERRIGRIRVFVNGENLMDVRQNRWDPIVRPGRGADGRWAVDAWAPLDGRNVNG